MILDTRKHEVVKKIRHDSKQENSRDLAGFCFNPALSIQHFLLDTRHSLFQPRRAVGEQQNSLKLCLSIPLQYEHETVLDCPSPQFNESLSRSVL
jgi:hypothetical protein